MLTLAVVVIAVVLVLVIAWMIVKAIFRDAAKIVGTVILAAAASSQSEAAKKAAEEAPEPLWRSALILIGTIIFTLALCYGMWKLGL